MKLISEEFVRRITFEENGKKITQLKVFLQSNIKNRMVVYIRKIF